MAETVRPSSEDRCALEPVTCWPLIYSAGAVLLLGAAVAVTLFAYDLLRPRAAVAEAPPPAKAIDEAPAASLDRGPDLPPVTVVEPPRAAPVRRVVAREYVPLPPAKPRETEGWGLRVRLKAKAGKTDKGAKKAGPAESLPRQRHTLTREELLASLQKQAVELDLDSEKDAGKKLLEAGQKHAEKLKKIRESKDETEPSSLSSPLETLLASRKDLKGLPLLLGRACQTDKEQAKVLGTVSLKFRRLQSEAQRQEARNSKTKTVTPSQSSSYSHQDEAEKLAYRQGQLGYVDKGLKDFLYVSVKAADAARLVRPFEQTYQTETPGMRVELVAALSKVKGTQATQAIARRAVFDLSPLVREEAVNALRGRGYEEAREVFLAAMRHPWAPAADHAAEALVALEDDRAVKELTALLELPDPSLPVKQGDKWTSKQLVRVNHLRNCLLCHAPSTETSDLVRGPVPTPGEPLPQVYYNSRSRGPSVRADVVYFRQDFSAMHVVEKPNKWPAVQRFDYLVQAREVSADVAAQRLKEAKERKTYPQREAAAWALAMLQRKQLD